MVRRRSQPGLRSGRCCRECSARTSLRRKLDLVGLLAPFEPHVYSADDVTHAKPAPDLFLHAAKTMGTEPINCVVIEDTPTGTKAGVAAGMKVFGYAGAPHSDAAGLAAHGATVFWAMHELPALLAAE